MTSWQTYVDDYLVGTGLVEKAAVISSDRVWAKSPNLELTEEELGGLLKVYERKDLPKDRQPAQVTLGGDTFDIVMLEGRSLYARKGFAGVVVVVGNQVALIAFYGDKTQPGRVVHETEKLIDHLIKSGY